MRRWKPKLGLVEDKIIIFLKGVQLGIIITTVLGLILSIILRQFGI